MSSLTVTLILSDLNVARTTRDFKAPKFGRVWKKSARSVDRLLLMLERHDPYEARKQRAIERATRY